MNNLKPMGAVAALYSTEDQELAEAIVECLSRAIFHGSEIRLAGKLKRVLANLSYRVMHWTTKSSKSTDHLGEETTVFSNALLKRSKHPYAHALLSSSRSETAALVEGGDPMNGPYMMIPPEIRKNCGLWDTLFFDSVQGRDVQSRIIWETRSTYESAKHWLDAGKPVRLKAVAAGTGLSMILVYDKLIRDGYDPTLITARITDRDEANMVKTNRLLNKLSSTRDKHYSGEKGYGISAEPEDIFEGIETPDHLKFHVVTAIGIFEYFHGFSYDTTDQKHRIETVPGAPTGMDLAVRLAEMTADGARLIVNTYRDDASTRILELFGKKFVYRSTEDLKSLLAAVHFQPTRTVGSGNIYDVKIYEKRQG
ncbi:MAG: hypothetical protein RL693_2582 [Verrucomicrobiota bacterium]|jgi:hypothetical protein